MWWLSIVILTASRWHSVRRITAESVNRDNAARLGLRFGLGVGAIALARAIRYVRFSTFLASDYQILIVVVLAGLSAGALVGSYGVKRQFYRFSVPALGTPALYCLTQGSAVSVWTAVLVCIYVVALMLGFSRYARAITELISTRLENAQLVATLSTSNAELHAANEQLTELSSTDSLTQIANRRYFDQVLHREWARAQRAGNQLVYIMVDVDFFKPFNDHYGHLRGDDCLKLVAKTLQGELRRPGDFLGRYSGEEMAVISPDTPIDGAVALGEKIRACIEALQIPHEGSPAASCITAVVPEEDNSVDDLIQRADKALYQAKRRGRNKVILGVFEITPR
jgi:diguanylate cyclase (GGDEF)-like protein